MLWGSLTTELNDPGSPVRWFFKTHFPLPVHQLRTLRPTTAALLKPPLSPIALRSTIGIAFDYRVRFYFALTPISDLVAYSGAFALMDLRESLPSNVGPACALAIDFFLYLEERLSDLRPVGRKLPPEAEAELDRFCFILALYDAIFRAGPSINSPLFTLKKSAKNAGVLDLLALVSQEAIDDLSALSYDFHDDALSMFGHPFVANPTFAGSGDLGGADADFIIDCTLFELKTVVDADLWRLRGWLHQLLGYTLLDYDDTYRIRGLGVWLPRYRQQWVIPLSSVLPQMQGRSSPASEIEVATWLANLRYGFRRLLIAGPDDE